MKSSLFLFAIWAFAGCAAMVGVVDKEIPNSNLTITIPENWNTSTPYVGDGKYSSIQAYLPKEKHGGYPGHPEFEFEYLAGC